VRGRRTGLRQRLSQASPALKLVLLIGVMSFFADFPHEGSRSIIGPYLGLLGVRALGISVITGAGEFPGYGLRLFSGRGADRTGRDWPITIAAIAADVRGAAARPGRQLAGRRAADHRRTGREGHPDDANASRPVRIRPAAA
jgi:hypothetical protein